MIIWTLWTTNHLYCTLKKIQTRKHVVLVRRIFLLNQKVSEYKAWPTFLPSEATKKTVAVTHAALLSPTASLHLESPLYSKLMITQRCFELSSKAKLPYGWTVWHSVDFVFVGFILSDCVWGLNVLFCSFKLGVIGSQPAVSYKRC